MRVAYRSIRGRRKFAKSPQIRRYMEDWLIKDVVPHITKRFKAVVSNWKTRVIFKAKKRFKKDSMSVLIYPSKGEKIWGYVVKGTRPHIIRGWPVLAFRTGYKPKTLPKAKFGGPGKATGKMAFATVVHHPGSKPRPFPEEIAKDEKPWFSRNAENAWRRAIRLV